MIACGFARGRALQARYRKGGGGGSAVNPIEPNRTVLLLLVIGEHGGLFWLVGIG